MIMIETYDVPAKFLERVEQHLLKYEVENNLALGLLRNMVDDPSIPFAKAFRGGVCVHKENTSRSFHSEDQDYAAEVMQCFMIAGRNIVLTYPWDDTAKNVVIPFLKSEGWHIPGVDGPRENVDAFVTGWFGDHSPRIRRVTQTIIHRANHVNFPKTAKGAFYKPVTQGDMKIAAQWMIDFASEVDADAPPPKSDECFDRIEKLSRKGHVYLWRDDTSGEILSMCILTRRSQNARNISYVYTPAEHRKKGYAGNVVAFATAEILSERDVHFVTLYTDAANPTSNKIYKEIGFRSVLETQNITFKKQTI